MDQQSKSPAGQGEPGKFSQLERRKSNLSAIGRLQVIIDAAERSATEIAESAALLAKRASEIRIESEELLASLEETRAEIENHLRGAPAGSHRQDQPQDKETDSKLDADGPGADDAAGLSDGARLLATQMSVAGSNRDEIESRLRNEFNIDEPESMLDGILGFRESPAEDA
jgi:hypothetical protein